MPSESASKRAKKLVQQLFELQNYDMELSGPLCLAVKHSLRGYSRHCRVVEVMAGPETDTTIHADRDAVPKFISSQLEAQRLTSQGASSALLLSPLVNYILSCIPALLTRDNAIATLFYWQSLTTHRTVCIFAFVDDTATMPSQTYTVEELFRLRGQGIPMSLSDAPQKGANHCMCCYGLATSSLSPCSFKLTAAVAIRSGLIGRQIGSESRTIGRFHRCRQQHDQPQQIAFLRTKDDVLDTDSDPSIGKQFRQDTASSMPGEVEWRYRGRASSEATSSAEPLSAPTGLNAQQSEGFQRFYKAVISPTHVRVTAGGRIVPNTRGTSPMSKQIKEKPENGSQTKNDTPQADDHDQRSSEPQYMAAPKIPAVPLFAFSPHPFYPQFSGPLPGMPMMPMPMGLGMPSGMPFSHQAPPANSSSLLPQPELSKALSKENQQSDHRRDVSGYRTPALGRGDEKNGRMPSENFDHTRPFIINGQVVYPFSAPALSSPLAQGNQHAPPGFSGHPSFPIPAFHNPMLGPPPFAMNHLLNPPVSLSSITGPLQASAANYVQPPPSAVANSGNASSSQALQPPTAPPVSSIRPSDISRKQIEMLRSSLKYHEDQLLYNRHQIDEKEMENTIQMLQSQIDRFEALNQSQLRFEETHYPKKDVKPDEPVSIQQPRGMNRSSHSGSSTHGTTKHASNSTRRSDSLRHKPFLRKKEPFFNLDPVETSFQPMDPVKKSTLPSCAALAPPFEPRALLNMDKAIDKQGPVTFQCDGTTAEDVAALNDTDMFQRVKECAGQVKLDSCSSNGTKPCLEKPYLVGSLPHGIDPKSARDTDYVYERELTQDEIRSRYLYLGRAPSFTRKGLPKFDGKDFYPTSPNSDEAAKESSPPPLQSRHIPVGDPIGNYYAESYRTNGAQFTRPLTSTSNEPKFTRVRHKPVKVTLVSLPFELLFPAGLWGVQKSHSCANSTKKRRPDTKDPCAQQPASSLSPKVAGVMASNDNRQDKKEPQGDQTRCVGQQLIR